MNDRLLSFTLILGLLSAHAPMCGALQVIGDGVCCSTTSTSSCCCDDEGAATGVDGPGLSATGMVPTGSCACEAPAPLPARWQALLTASDGLTLEALAHPTPCGEIALPASLSRPFDGNERACLPRRPLRVTSGVRLL